MEQRKSKTMRVAALLCVLTLITTCFVGGTLAKYTSTASGQDDARVAYWGFTTTSFDMSDLFAADYTDVKADEDVIAPGTTGSDTFEFVYTGTKNAPEVDYTIFVDASKSTCDDAIKNNANIKWYFDGKLAPASGTAAEGSWDALIAAIEALDGNVADNKYTAGSIPAGFAKGTSHTVKWVWDFTGADSQDATDTTMGNAANAKVNLEFTITATQVDGTPIS